ncbi:uncharacterized protein B0T15DRAFT_496114 [Chaetomium strumarium]|uniref:Uncharacterized protein n=1 Tax=Chaetomium strumarium TaxID=1170767 RepID=A0AAJ0LZN2_9PEZI|nr:hypothetical protein B0T15DRAFT_496114 [Chaetomium strumarium]
MARLVKNYGTTEEGGTPKIRRFERLKDRQRQREAAEQAVSEQLGRLDIQEQASRKPPRTPSPPGRGDVGSALPPTDQLEVISPESMELERDRSKDEEIVNSALIHLLVTTTLCSGIGTIAGREGLAWMPTRQTFRLGPAGDSICEAKTDGILYNGIGPGYTLAILEVKPYVRRIAQQKIEWQEACQMATWISTSLDAKTKDKRREGVLHTSDDGKYRRILISQDYRYLFITISEWGQAYERYLRGGSRPVTPPSKNSSPSQNRGRTATAAAMATQQTASWSTGPTAEAATGTTAAEPASTKAAATGPGTKEATESARHGNKATAEDLDDGNYLIMNCYGPYSLDDKRHVTIFLRNVIALILEVSDPWE